MYTLVQTPLGSAPASMNVPAVMPVSVPVSSTSSVHRTIHQHLKGQMQQLESQRSSGSSAGPLSSGPMSANSSVASLFSPQRYMCAMCDTHFPLAETLPPLIIISTCITYYTCTCTCDVCLHEILSSCVCVLLCTCSLSSHHRGMCTM